MKRIKSVREMNVGDYILCVDGEIKYIEFVIDIVSVDYYVSSILYSFENGKWEDNHRDEDDYKFSDYEKYYIITESEIVALII